MKKFFQYILIIAFFSFWGIILANKSQFRETFQGVLGINQPCAKPIRYSIGTLDPRFGLSQGDFLKTISEAESVWEIPLEKDLFQYDPSAEFKINLIYDSRQSQTIESQNMEEKLEKLESTHDEMANEYNSASVVYKKRMDAYNASVADYKNELEDYNAKVKKWNGQGGAPSDIYDKLKKERKDLDKKFETIEKERLAINSLAGKTNNLAQKSNQIADVYNQNLNTYKDKFGGAVQFDKGFYDGQKVDIYQFYETSDLRLTVVHELGHALGIDHLVNSSSIMYYLMGDQNMDNPVATEEDVGALKNVCKIK